MPILSLHIFFYLMSSICYSCRTSTVPVSLIFFFLPSKRDGVITFHIFWACKICMRKRRGAYLQTKDLAYIFLTECLPEKVSKNQAAGDQSTNPLLQTDCCFFQFQKDGRQTWEPQGILPYVLFTLPA